MNRVFDAFDLLGAAALGAMLGAMAVATLANSALSEEMRAARTQAVERGFARWALDESSGEVVLVWNEVVDAEGKKIHDVERVGR